MRRSGPDIHFLPNAAPQFVVLKCEPPFGLGGCGRKAIHADQEILTIPGIGPPPVLKKIPIQIVTCDLQSLRHENVASRRRSASGRSDRLPEGRTRVVDSHNLLEVFAVPIVRDDAINRNAIRSRGQTEDVEAPRGWFAPFASPPDLVLFRLPFRRDAGDGDAGDWRAKKSDSEFSYPMSLRQKFGLLNCLSLVFSLEEGAGGSGSERLAAAQCPNLWASGCLFNHEISLAATVWGSVPKCDRVTSHVPL